MSNPHKCTVFGLVLVSILISAFSWADNFIVRKRGNIKFGVHPSTVCSRPSNVSRFIATAGTYGKILCDAETDGGGWIVILRRHSGKLNFNNEWSHYSSGFGDVNEEFWMGNFYVFLLTSGGPYFLRIDMKYKGKSYFAKYSRFRLRTRNDNYRLRLSTYLGGDAGDSLSYHNNSVFSTSDRDNNMHFNKYRCVDYAHAPWWYYYCQHCLLFGKWKSKKLGMGVNWLTLTGYNDSLDYVEMKVKYDTKWY